MIGEVLNAADITQSELLGDRAYALIDGADEKVDGKRLHRAQHRFEHSLGEGFACVVRRHTPTGELWTSSGSSDKQIARLPDCPIASNAMG
jgi:uncharacterized protein YcbX